MINFIKYIIISKKIYFFHPGEKVDILIFGRINSRLNLGQKIKFFELNDQIYLSSFLKSLIIFLTGYDRNFKEIYFKEVVKLFSPKLALGDEINSNIFKFKKYFPNKIAIGFQIVNRSNITTNKSKNRITCDYFILFNKKSKKYYKHLDTKFLINGSLKNNEKPLKTKKKVFDLMFISEYRPNVFLKISAQSNEQLKIFQGIKKNFYHFNEIILDILNEVISEHNLKICIALASNRIEKQKISFKKREIEFFSRKIKNVNFPNYNSY